MIDLQGKTALVTGASRGIGAACAESLADAGAAVVISYLVESPRADSLARRIEQRGGRALTLAADLRRPDEVEMLVSETVDRFGSIDIVVNNAGIWTEAPVDQMTDAEWEDMLAINLSGPFLVTRAAVPHMKRAGGGRLIFISSTAGQRGEAFHSHYAATKGGLISFTKSLAAELAPDGILVNCVAPGWVATDMTTRPLAEPGAEKILEQIPLGRVGRPEEIAGAVLFLASDLSTFVTGEILNVNGGAVLVG